jgi:hypothetical protein
MTGCDGGERRDDENFAEDNARESRLFRCEAASRARNFARTLPDEADTS